MHFFGECVFLSALWALYWAYRERRRYLRQRIGNQAFKNVYRVGRNVCFMLRRKELEIGGDLGVLNAGCVLYSFHFGVWELMPLALSKCGYKIGILVNSYHANNRAYRTRMLDFLLRRWRSVNGVRVFYKENALEITRFLRSGGVFGMLVDGNTLFQKYGKARKLAELCRVPLVPFAAYRQRGKGFLRIGCDIPALIRSMPLDYVWFYKSR
jgi:lauroyl/myristoyl acyltransferase